MSAELAYVSATELVHRYRAKQLSPVEVAQAVLARIGELNPSLNAFCLIDEAGALAAARAAEARWMKGAPLGWVDGVPASIKDLILTRGWPTLRGSKTVDREGPWLEDGPAAARLRENGALLDPGLQHACASGSQHTLAKYLDAVNARGALGEHMKRFHQNYDLLLTPRNCRSGVRRRRARAGTPGARGGLDLVDAVFLSLQPDAAAGNVRPLRLFRGRLAHRPAACRPDAARGSGIARGACLPAGDRPSLAPAAAMIAPAFLFRYSTNDWRI